MACQEAFRCRRVIFSVSGIRAGDSAILKDHPKHQRNGDNGNHGAKDDDGGRKLGILSVLFREHEVDHRSGKRTIEKQYLANARLILFQWAKAKPVATRRKTGMTGERGFKKSMPEEPLPPVRKRQ